jgi:hypothetical protein
MSRGREYCVMAHRSPGAVPCRRSSGAGNGTGACAQSIRAPLREATPLVDELVGFPLQARNTMLKRTPCGSRF